MIKSSDIIVIGGGIAGSSVAAHLAQQQQRVIVLEMEDQPGYHSTGRSAAAYIANYGNTTIRKLNRASRSLLENPPADFSEQSFLAPRGAIYLAHPGGEAELQELIDSADDIEAISATEAVQRVPILRPDTIVQAALEADVMDIDVNSLHQAYLRRLKALQGQVVCNAEVQQLTYQNGLWQLDTAAGQFAAPIVVNAAGAWADKIAGLAGLAPIGLSPRRRTAAIVTTPAELEIAQWPIVCDIEEAYYFKPEGGRLLISPADETPVEPHDAYSDEMALAGGIDKFEQASTFSVQRVEHQRAGLRTFAPDRCTVVGFEPTAEGFFWLAGQGGYGIQTAPAMASLATSLLCDDEVPDELLEQGLAKAEIDPARFR